MKKLLAILAVAGFLTACSDGGTAEEAKSADSATTAPAPTDTTTTAPADTTTAVPADSSKVATDTTKK